MYSISTLVLVGIAALLLGAGIGLLTGRRMTPDTRKQRELERNLDRLLQQQKDYQHEVVEHFTDTSKLLNNLAESYRDVHNHLASGANNLCDDPVGKIMQRLPESSISDLATDPELGEMQAPLDYAPKASPFATGVLNEEFGLDKSAEAEAEAEAEILADAAIPRQAG